MPVLPLLRQEIYALSKRSYLHVSSVHACQTAAHHGTAVAFLHFFRQRQK